MEDEHDSSANRDSWEYWPSRHRRCCVDGGICLTIVKMRLLAVAFILQYTLVLANVPSLRTTLSFFPGLEYRPVDSEHDLQLPLSHIPLVPDATTLTLAARPTTVYRPRSHTAVQRARLRSLHSHQSEKIEWEQVDTRGPDIEDAHTLVQLARMTGNAYALPGQKNWYDIDPAWNTVRTNISVV